MADKNEKLKKAYIRAVDKITHREKGPKIECMFNPFEYTVSKTNSFKEPNAANGKSKPDAEFSKAGAQALKLSLMFDTHEAGTDVSLITEKLWKFMEVIAHPGLEKKSPPLVVFHWGVFDFISYITQMSQKFTLFTHKGIPVRAKVDVTFTQYIDEDDYDRQNPTSGGGPIHSVWTVSAGERLDFIANEVYRDASKWSLIASHNQLVDPSSLRPGQTLTIPLESTYSSS